MCRCAPRLDKAKADTEGAEHRDAALREVGRARQADAASTLRQASMVESAKTKTAEWLAYECT